MATKAAINFHYRHPGRTTASLQATVADVPQLIHTHQGPEVSLGPVTFFTCFGSYYSGCLPHGGWNYTRASLWLAFNWRGSRRPAWKVVFIRHHDGLWKAVHPFEPGVVVTLQAHSMYRWVRHTPRSIALGTWIRTTSGSTPPPGMGGYLEVAAMEEVCILYEGVLGDEAGWFYCSSHDARCGWVNASCFETADWQLVEGININDVVV